MRASAPEKRTPVPRHCSACPGAACCVAALSAPRSWPSTADDDLWRKRGEEDCGRREGVGEKDSCFEGMAYQGCSPMSTSRFAIRRAPRPSANSFRENQARATVNTYRGGCRLEAHLVRKNEVWRLWNVVQHVQRWKRSSLQLDAQPQLQFLATLGRLGLVRREALDYIVGLLDECRCRVSIRKPRRKQRLRRRLEDCSVCSPLWLSRDVCLHRL
jgi:hypothetical protein